MTASMAATRSMQSLAPPLLTVVSVLAVLRAPTFGGLLVGACLCAFVFATRPHWFLYGAAFFAFATLPSTWPYAIYPGDVIVPFYAILLAAAAVYSAQLPGTVPGLPPRVLLLSAVLASGLAVGVVQHNNAVILAQEVLNLSVVIVAFFVSARVHTLGPVSVQRCALRCLLAVLWVSAGMIVLATLGLVDVAGRAETAHLGGEASSATRVLTATQFLAFVAFVVILAAALQGLVSAATASLWLTPSLVILGLAFSRNSLLGLAAGLLVTLLSLRGSLIATLGRSVKAVAIAAATLATVALAIVGLGGGGYLANQLDAYQLRVLGGLGSEARALDPSALAREREVQALTDHMRFDRPFGEGFGFAYQAGYGTGDDFTATLGRYSAHQFYLWLAVKAGFIGLFTWIAVFGSLVLLLVVRPVPGWPLAWQAGAMGLLIVCIVAPLPTDLNNNVAFGATFGLLLASTRRHGGEDEERSLSGRPPLYG